MANTNKAVYTRLVARIIDAMERGETLPWQREWTLGHNRNAVSLRPYSGINVWLCLWDALVSGYTSTGWMTFKQARENGLAVRQGEHGTAILYMSKVQVGKKSRVRAEDPVRTFFLAKAYTVFNLDQMVESVNAPGRLAHFRDRCAVGTARDPIPEAETFIRATGADIVHTPYSGPAYDWTADRISMPMRYQFESPAAYYATLFHELIHWSGHRSRLDRTMGQFASAPYAAEELVAELGAAFLAHAFGFDIVSRSATYLASWLAALRADPTMLIQAASAATKAVTLLRPETFAEPGPDEEAVEEVIDYRLLEESK